jgi:hypothetical protein
MRRHCHIDTAAASLVLLETKIWLSDDGYDQMLHGFEESAGEVDGDQINRLILHQALPSSFDRTLRRTGRWKGLLAAGHVRAIGVSNVMVDHLTRLLDRVSVICRCRSQQAVHGQRRRAVGSSVWGTPRSVSQSTIQATPGSSRPRHPFSSSHENLRDRKRNDMTTLVAVADVEAPASPAIPSTAPAIPLASAARPFPSEPAVSCPACGGPATVEWRDTVPSTSGPVVHVKLRCPLGRHWFLMPEEGLHLAEQPTSTASH